ncbi:glycosyltransferase family 2 protein [Clostridiales bacterium]|nr:glycosyltransferase family 2 protein [Clostridiales bacterium]
MEPLVSVIIPVYNVLPYLREALDSVINQTYTNLEIIVVDDGSTDGSGAVCDEYLSDPRVIVIHQENRGLSGARNTGLDRMTGEYVAFLDSDDAFQPNMIACMITSVDQNKADVVICGYDECYTQHNLSSEKKQRIKRSYFSKESVLSSSEFLNMLLSGTAEWAVWNKIYCHWLWNDLRFPEGYNYEDMQIDCVLFEKCSRIATLPGSFLQYRNRPDSITSSNSEKNILDCLVAVKTIEEYVISHTPSVFPKETLSLFLERYARTLSMKYSHLLLHDYNPTILTNIHKEILLQWKHLEFEPLSIKSKITRSLFLYTPSLVYPIRSCWQLGKRILGKATI